MRPSLAIYLRADVGRLSFGDPGTALFGRFGHLGADVFGKLNMLRLGWNDGEFHKNLRKRMDNEMEKETEMDEANQP